MFQNKQNFYFHTIEGSYSDISQISILTLWNIEMLKCDIVQLKHAQINNLNEVTHGKPSKISFSDIYVQIGTKLVSKFFQAGFYKINRIYVLKYI